MPVTLHVVCVSHLHEQVKDMRLVVCVCNECEDDGPSLTRENA